MSLGKVVFYDYEHCQEFLEEHAKQLRETSTGLNALGLYRELFYGFTHEALESSAITIGQFDGGIVYMFIPEMLSREYYPAGHKVAREKSLELLSCTSPPMVFEMLAAHEMEPKLSDNASCRKWMRPELQTLIDANAIQIQMYFNGEAFFEQLLKPSLLQQGYTLAGAYLDGAKTGFVRVRHPSAPGKIFKLPWIRWIREMMAGGYSMAYLMACLGSYTLKMNEAIPGGNPTPSQK